MAICLWQTCCKYLWEQWLIAVVVFHDENKTAISAFQDSHKPMHYNGTEINTNIQYQYLHVHDKRMDVTQ